MPAGLGQVVPARCRPVPSLGRVVLAAVLQTQGQVKLLPDPSQPMTAGISAGAAGRPHEPSPRRPQPRCVWEAGMGRRWQGMAGRFLLALVGLSLSGLQFRSSLEDGVH